MIHPEPQKIRKILPPTDLKKELKKLKSRINFDKGQIRQIEPAVEEPKKDWLSGSSLEALNLNIRNAQVPGPKPNSHVFTFNKDPSKLKKCKTLET
jgi:hypothetical protein